MATQLALLVSLSLLAQDAPKTVTYETVAVPVSRALDEISKLSGTTLKASPQTANEIVVVRFDKAPLDEIKTRLAKAVTGTWATQPDGTELLVADERTRREQQAKEDLEHFKQIEEGLKAMAESLKPPKPKPKDAKADPEGIQEFEDVSVPEGSEAWFVAVLASGLRANELAGIAKGYRVVYSTSPNAMQRPLTARNVPAAVDLYVKTYNANFDKNLEGRVVNDEEEKMAKKAMELFGVEPPAPPKKIDSGVSKVLLIAERGGLFGFMGDMVTLRFTLYNAKGEVVSGGSRTLSGGYGMPGMVMGETVAVEAVPVAQEGQEPKEQEKPDPQLDKPLVLSETSLELSKLTNFNGMMPEIKPPSEALMAKLLRPDLYDPLSFDISDGLLGIAMAKGLQLAACLPDAVVNFSSFMRGKSEKLQQVYTLLKSNEELEMAMDGGWMAVQPAHPHASRSDRLDRVAFAKFLQTAAGTPVLRLDPLADYATKNPPLTETPAAMGHVMLVCPNAMSRGFIGMQDWPMLRLYGSLNSSQRQSLRQGGTVPFGAMSGVAATTARQMVYGTGATFETGATMKDRPSFVRTMFGAMRDGGGKDYREEPTELLPSGLPSFGGLRLKVTTTNFVSLAGDKGGPFARMFGSMGAEELGLISSFTESPEMAGFSAMMPKMDAFKVGNRDELTFSLELAADVRQVHMLLDDSIDPNAKVVAKDQLPPTFLAKMEEMRKLFKEGLGMFMGRGMGGPALPPQ